ncbi:MAG: PQ-loop domain-containing transporter [Candidatus Moranbacteria bacterium]|nr:PQ-loop domain-containing transporter [Candidatus Moranbacteria bacterium]
MNIEIVGFAGSAIIASALIPQVIKSWTTKSTEDISLLWNSLLLAGLILFVIYGIGISSRPIMIFTTIEASLTLSLLILKLIHKKR